METTESHLASLGNTTFDTCSEIQIFRATFSIFGELFDTCLRTRDFLFPLTTRNTAGDGRLCLLTTFPFSSSQLALASAMSTVLFLHPISRHYHVQYLHCHSNFVLLLILKMTTFTRTVKASNHYFPFTI
jgi:hypothetical protein